MSFSYDIKKEIADDRTKHRQGKKALCYGLFLFARAFSEEEVSIRTEHREVAALYLSHMKSLLGSNLAVSTEVEQRQGREVYTIFLPLAEDRLKLISMFPKSLADAYGHIVTKSDAPAFLSGAFLACGNATNPEKSYHLEFVTRDKALGEGLAKLLCEHIPGAKATVRRGQHVVYYKECSQIEDLLTLMGGVRASLAMIDVEMIKGVRNRANRATNCETANIDKLVGAATAQIQDIQFLLGVLGTDSWPDKLLETAKLRLENPEASLRELVELSPAPVSRSGIHHRLTAISRMAAEIRADRND